MSSSVQVRIERTVRAISRTANEGLPAQMPTANRGRIPRVAQVLALAIHFQEMIDAGEVRSYTDLTRLGCVSRERISQVMMLSCLAPDIQNAILTLPQTPGGRFHIGEALIRPIARLPLWKEQRRRWLALSAGGGA